MKVYCVIGDSSDHAIVESGLTFPEPRWNQFTEAAREFQSVTHDLRSLACHKVTSDDNPLGDFAHFAILSCFHVVFPRALENIEIREAITDSGELLPLDVDGRDAFLWNVLRKCEDALDYPRSRVYNGSTNSPVFIPSSLPERGFFRIPEAWSRIYLVEPGEGGFLRRYKQLKLSGLRFEECPLLL